MFSLWSNIIRLMRVESDWRDLEKLKQDPLKKVV